MEHKLNFFSACGYPEAHGAGCLAGSRITSFIQAANFEKVH